MKPATKKRMLDSAIRYRCALFTFNVSLGNDSINHRMSSLHSCYHKSTVKQYFGFLCAVGNRWHNCQTAAVTYLCVLVKKRLPNT